MRAQALQAAVRCSRCGAKCYQGVLVLIEPGQVWSKIWCEDCARDCAGEE